MEDQYSNVFGDKNRVMTVFAHPDDLEITCGGLIARLRADGKAVRTICMTLGERGIGYSSRDVGEFGEQRFIAQVEAAVALGVSRSEVFNLRMQDGGVENSLSTIERLVWHIREYRPDAIITHNPEGMVHSFTDEPFLDYVWINHRDHRMTAQSAFDAVYPYSRDHAFFPEQIAEGLSGHGVHTILFADAYSHRSAVTLDVQSFLTQKRAALEQHANTGALTEAVVEELGRVLSYGSLSA